MNIREAILATARHLEKYPEEFDFSTTDVPTMPHCGSPGCAIGWILSFTGTAADWSHRVIRHVLGVTETGFYYRMNELSNELGVTDSLLACWTRDAQVCVRLLRRYADKYHPALPDWEALSQQPLVEEAAHAGL